MRECFKCLRGDSEVKLVEAVYGGEVVKICEECALSEQLPIIRKPTSFQLEASEKPYTVRERLSRLAGLPVEKKVQEEIKHGITLDKLRPAKDYSRIIQEKADRAKKANQPINLIDNYNWHIQMARRARKLSLTQVSALVRESELTLKMIESGQTFDDILRVILKLEQFFKITLRKSEALKEQERVQQATKLIREPARILSFDRDTVNNLTLADLKRIKEEKERSERNERQEASKMAWQAKVRKEEAGKEKDIEDAEIEIIEDDLE